MLKPEVFLAPLHLRWDGPWQRPHHLLTRLARRVPVIVIEEPMGDESDRDDVRTIGNVTVVRPLRRRGWGEPLIDGQTLETVRQLVDSRACGAWLYTPMMSEIIERFNASPVIYDAMDELANFDFAPAGMKAREAALLARADVAFAGGRTLYENRRGSGANIHCFPSGVEVEKFAANTAPHPLSASLVGPVFAYVGVIDERLDYDIIAALADECTDADILLAGPVVKVDPAVLPQRPNVHYTGKMPYEMLPSLLAGADVGLMPFAINRATAGISPTKTLEYFAASLPVVSTPIADVVASYGDIVALAAGPGAFVAAVRDAMSASDDRIERGFAVAQTQSWDGIFERMWNLIPV